MNDPRKKLDPLEFVLALSVFAAGSVDVISFARLGGIFASAMTGNIAFLALYYATGKMAAAAGSLVALFGFMFGAASATLLTQGRPDRQAITILLRAETLLLLAVCLLWFTVQRNLRLSTDGLILILAIAMGLQSICGKKINLSSIPTVVFTSTLTNIVIGVTERLMRRRTELPADTKRQIVSFCVYFIGAFSAGLLKFFDLNLIIFLPLAAVTLALSIHLRKIVTS